MDSKTFGYVGDRFNQVQHRLSQTVKGYMILFGDPGSRKQG